MDKLIGRNAEQYILQQIYEQPHAQLIAVIGRRRIGKTFLITQYFKDRLNLIFTGIDGGRSREQLQMFSRTMVDTGYCLLRHPSDWFEAFRLLKDYLSSLPDERRVVFFDDFPWLSSRRSNFLSAFAFFWKNWAESQRGLKIIVSGSNTSWMIAKLIGSQGVLSGCFSQVIHLRPYNLAETEDFLQVKGISWNRHLILQTYMIFGGIPYYLDLLQNDQPFTANIDRLLFDPSAKLREEYELLFQSLFQNPAIYFKVMQALVFQKHGLTLEELKLALSIGDGGYLTAILATLITNGFVRSCQTFGKRKKGCLYQVIDPFCIFHLSFVARTTEHDPQFWSKTNPAKRQDWNGFAFELVCLLHVQQIMCALQLNSMSVCAYSWSVPEHTDKDGIRWPGAQIDLIFDRADHIVDLCEIKFTLDPFIITASYEKTLRERMENFVRTTGTRSAIRLVFITNEGVRENIHSGIVQGNITANDLFCDFKSIMQ